MANTNTYDYVDNVGLEYTLTKLYQFLNTTFGFRGYAETTMPGAAIAEKVFYDKTTSKLDANTVQAAIDKIVSDYAALSGATFTGSVKVVTPTPADSDKETSTEATNVAYVTAAINAALAGISGIEFDGPYANYATLVATVTSPKKGTIYLVSNSGTVPNANDEYFWNGTEFELFGSTAVDLSGYVKTTDLKSLTTDEIKTAFINAGFPTPS